MAVMVLCCWFENGFVFKSTKIQKIKISTHTHTGIIENYVKQLRHCVYKETFAITLDKGCNKVAERLDGLIFFGFNWMRLIIIMMIQTASMTPLIKMLICERMKPFCVCEIK